MRQSHRRYPLTPAGLVVEHIEIGPERMVAHARLPSRTSPCPSCGTVSARVHSRYRRSLADLLAHGRAVAIELVVRRFRCGRRTCARRIFAERLDAAIAVPFGRRTARMDGVVHRLGLALGGRPGHALAQRLAIPVSKDTLLRPCVGALFGPIGRFAPSASMIGPGGVDAVMERSFAILSASTLWPLLPDRRIAGSPERHCRCVAARSPGH